MTRKVNHKSLKSLRIKLWKIFSQYVRQRDGGRCFTCGIIKPIKEMQAGHYIHKDCLDFDEMNINCQCVRCNKYLSGNLGIYAERLIEKYGEEEVQRLRIRSQEAKKFNVEELESMIQTYSDSLKQGLE